MPRHHHSETRLNLDLQISSLAKRSGAGAERHGPVSGARKLCERGIRLLWTSALVMALVFDPRDRARAYMSLFFLACLKTLLFFQGVVPATVNFVIAHRASPQILRGGMPSGRR